jgi:hypothetical protein
MQDATIARPSSRDAGNVACVPPPARQRDAARVEIAGEPHEGLQDIRYVTVMCGYKGIALIERAVRLSHRVVVLLRSLRRRASVLHVVEQVA